MKAFGTFTPSPRCLIISFDFRRFITLELLRRLVLRFFAYAARLLRFASFFTPLSPDYFRH